MRIRHYRASDLPVVHGLISAGLDSWRAFTAPSWEPVEQDAERERRLRERLGLADTWARVAFEGDAPAGHVVVTRHPDEPELGYLWQLFVRPEWWGTGLAGRLHDQAVVEMRLRGHGEAELWTPRDHRRARRFYEREGWVAGRKERDSEISGLVQVLYRRSLSP